MISGDRMFLFLRVKAAWLGLCVVAAGGAGESQVTIKFAGFQITPRPDLPREARNAGIGREPGSAATTEAGVSFGVVSDDSSHGPFSRIVSNRIASLVVTWADEKVFKDRAETEDFLRRLLNTQSGSTYTYVPWA